MLDRIIYNVSPAGQMWKVTLEGSDHIWGPFNSKHDALEFAKGLVNLNSLGQVRSEKRNGKFQTNYIYDEVLFPPNSRRQLARA